MWPLSLTPRPHRSGIAGRAALLYLAAGRSRIDKTQFRGRTVAARLPIDHSFDRHILMDVEEIAFGIDEVAGLPQFTAIVVMTDDRDIARNALPASRSRRVLARFFARLLSVSPSWITMIGR
jgi:hypothetical protein